MYTCKFWAVGTIKVNSILIFSRFGRQEMDTICPGGFNPHLGWSSRCRNCYRTAEEHFSQRPPVPRRNRHSQSSAALDQTKT